MVEYAMRNTYDNSVLIGRRAVAVLNRAKSIRTGREDTECMSIHWKIAADDSRWVELDADGFRVDGARWCAVGVRVDMTEQAATSVVDFLDTKTPKEHLGIALAVLREFLTSHNHAEDMSASMVHWVKFDQFHEFLAHLVDGKDLRLDTIAYRAWVAENRPK